MGHLKRPKSVAAAPRGCGLAGPGCVLLVLRPAVQMCWVGGHGLGPSPSCTCALRAARQWHSTCHARLHFTGAAACKSDTCCPSHVLRGFLCRGRLACTCSLPHRQLPTSPTQPPPLGTLFSGEWVDKPPRGTLFTEDEARAAGEGEEGGRLLAARSQQSDHSFDDEYPDR